MSKACYQCDWATIRGKIQNITLQETDAGEKLYPSIQMITKYFQDLFFHFRNSNKLNQKQDTNDTSVTAVLCTALPDFRMKILHLSF